MVTHELTFYLAAVVLLVLTVESGLKLLKGDSFSITLFVYGTVFAWYFVDPFITPEQYDYILPFLIGQSYGQVALFLIGFRVFVPVAVRWTVRRRNAGVLTQSFTPEQILIAAGAIWLSLFIIGIARLGGDVVGAVLPLDSRAGVTMWGRGAIASSASGFLIAFAGYMFNAITAFLGVLIFFQRSIFWRLLAAGMFAITLPYFFFEGARSHFLAAALPFILTYLLYARQPLVVKFAILAVALFCLDQCFKFGQILGPVAAGIIMALWSGLLIRWWEQRRSLLRLVLFMLGAGLTFNLGRDITLLVLWPVIFAYCFVRVAEFWGAKPVSQPPQVATFAHGSLRPVQVPAGRHL